ncbi:glycosyltransferase [Pseudanabaena sp. FACHB-2040]|nr:glycosyltransferase [Pseudanabaena sp. FACHB-2040]MBD2256791.1 glycosyltransferase [Pseudanabaena sp. FACHB-2040]
MISATFPYPPTLGGTPVRTFNLLKYLSQNHAVTLVTQRSAAVSDDEVEALRQWVHHLQVFPRPTEQNLTPGLVGKASRFARFAAQGRPSSVTYVALPAMQEWISRWVEAGKADAITCEHSVNEVFVQPHFRHRVNKVVANIHSSLYGTLINQLQTGTAEKPLRDFFSVALMRRYERRFARKFSDLVLTTEEDRRFFEPLRHPATLQIVPNGVDLQAFPYRSADPGGQNLVFVGALDYIANVDTAVYLAQTLLPALQQRYPDATLTLVGAKPTAQVQALAQLPGVTVTGRVPSVVDYLHQATVCVVPMRIGYGIKNKTLEAMAAGVPVVASDRGLEGLAVEHPLRALRANTTEDYVEAVGRLFEHPELRSDLSCNARALIEAEFTWEQAGQKYEQILLS